MLRWITTLTLTFVFFAKLAIQIESADAQEVHDVVMTTPFGPGERPTSADFYLNGRSIGKDRDAFETVIQQISHLPEGTSIIWGPNYARCGACSGREPACLPKHLFPELWAKLLKTAEERKMTLSSGYPEPWIRLIPPIPADQLPKDVFSDQPPHSQTFAVTLDWSCYPKEMKWVKRHRLSYNGEEIDRVALGSVLGKMEPKSRLLVRLTLANPASNDVQELSDLAANIHAVWRTTIAPPLRRSHLQSAIVVPTILFPYVGESAPRTRLIVEWRNYRGNETRHNEVIYLVDGAYVGRGDQGFDQVLSMVDALTKGATVVLPQYRLSGRMATEGKSRDEIERRNQELLDLAPFGNRRQKLDDVIRKRKLSLIHDDELPGQASTVVSWGGGDRRASAIASFGRIVYHGETSGIPSLRLGWSDYRANERRKREPESSARITLNEQTTGKGIDGFAAAMQQIEALPPGSLIQVKVCLKTKGPFTCPLIYDGHRHFERTGYEPYFGMFDWLIMVASTKQLEIEWLPDEAESCQDCELNK